MKEKVLKIIYKYYEENKVMPSIREIQNILKYKHHNSIYTAFRQLEKDGILVHTKRKWSLKTPLEEIKKIKVINEDHYIYTDNIMYDYYAFKMNNNYLKNDNILKNDYLIIKKTKSIKNNDIGLFKYNDNYHVMKYQFSNGFYILYNEKKKEILNKVKIIGKVVELQRKRVL